MRRVLSILAVVLVAPLAAAGELSHFGDFLLQSHFKVSGEKVMPIPMKAMVFRVYSDGVEVRVVTEDDEEARATFKIYRSDGIARQRSEGGSLEVVPGVQAMSTHGGVVRHLRLTRESFTITSFSGISDQTVISHAVAAVARPSPEATPAKAHLPP
jgi:hypothetical protein